LAEAYIGAFGLSKNTSAAERLINWKAPRGNNGFPERSGAGDFSLACYNEIKQRSTITSDRGKLSIAELNETLDRLATARDKQERIHVIRHLYDTMTPTEQKWVIRIILKDLKVSIRERTVLGVMHPDAIDLFNVCSDLRRVCWTLWSTAYRLPHEDSTVKIFLPFRPMLCKRQFQDFEGIIKTMNYHGNDVKNDGFIMEEKLDGERIQLHKRGDEFRYYSRKDKDYTVSLPWESL
jgi:DNA ligase-4